MFLGCGVINWKRVLKLGVMNSTSALGHVAEETC